MPIEGKREAIEERTINVISLHSNCPSGWLTNMIKAEQGLRVPRHVKTSLVCVA